MAMTTKRAGAVSKSKSTGAGKAVSPKPASGKPAFNKIRSAKAPTTKAATAQAAAHILPAAKGPRTISHRMIEEAVDKVFRERSHARA
jgi:hypothetical protein